MWAGVTKPKIARKTFLLFACLGLLIGTVMPIVEYLVLFTVDGLSTYTLQLFFKDAFVLADPWFSVVYIIAELVSLFLLARINRTMAAAALITATISTILLLNFVAHLPTIS